MDADEHDAQRGGATNGGGGTIGCPEGIVDGSAVSDAVIEDNANGDGIADTISADGGDDSDMDDGGEVDDRNQVDDDGAGDDEEVDDRDQVDARGLPRRVNNDNRALAYYADAARVVLPLVQGRLANAGAWVDIAADRGWESPDEALTTLYQVLYGVDSTSVVVPALFWSDVPAYFRAAQNIARAEVMLGFDRDDVEAGAGAELEGEALRKRTAVVLRRTAAWRSYLSDIPAGANGPRHMFVGHVPLDVKIDETGAALVSPRGAKDRMSARDAQIVPLPLRADAVFAWPALTAFAIFVPMCNTLDSPWVFQAIRLADEHLPLPLYVPPPAYSVEGGEGSAEGTYTDAGGGVRHDDTDANWPQVLAAR